MLGLNLGGRSYAWTSPPILALFAIALVIGAGFVWRLRTAPEPLIPIAVLRNPTRALLRGGAFVRLGLDHRAQYLPADLSAECRRAVGDRCGPEPDGADDRAQHQRGRVAASCSAKCTHYKALPIAGLVLAIAATATLAWWVDSLNLFWFEVLLILIGLGFGPMPGLAQVAMQNNVAAPSARHRGRHHELHAQPARHHAGRDVRRDRGGIGRRRCGPYAAARSADALDPRRGARRSAGCSSASPARSRSR